jgi:hypothetical protein
MAPNPYESPPEAAPLKPPPTPADVARKLASLFLVFIVVAIFLGWTLLLVALGQFPFLPISAIPDNQPLANFPA